MVSGANDQMASLADSSSSSLSSGVVTLTSSKFDPHLVSIKLAEDNFLPWRQQAMAMIRGYKLQKFLLGSHAIPRKYVNAEAEAQGKLSDDFLSWEQQDQLLLSWLLASMSESMLARMVGCDFSYQVWEKLESFFASQTKAKVIQLKTQLRNLKKGSLTVSEYLLKLKKTIDSLFSVGCIMAESDHIEAILEGLPEEYTSFIVSVTSRRDSYSVTELESLLLAQEERIEKFKKDASPVLSANISHTLSPQKNYPKNSNVPANSSGQSRFFNPSGQGNRFPNRGGFRGGNNRGRGGRSAANNRPQCQVCGKIGHMAWQCFQRFNQQFVSPFSQNFNSNFTSGARMQQPQSFSSATSVQAMMATPGSSFDSGWYADTGASNHLTSNLSALGGPAEYHGTEQVHLANGSGYSEDFTQGSC